MKKVLLTTLIAAAMVASVFAQGSVNVSASGGKIKFSVATDGSGAVSAPAGNPDTIGTWGNLHMALYSATLGTPSPVMGANGAALPSEWAIASPLINNVGPIAGAIGATVVTTSALSGAGGSQIQATLVAWTGTFLNFNDAIADGRGLLGWSGRFGIGGLSWAQGTGAPFNTPATAPANIVAGATAFNGLTLAPVPEPTTIALAGLGAAALLIFRRRK